jgi:hypothetical protein
MYTVKHGGDVQKGDLIAIANGNDFSIGIYYGQGRGTVQYFMPHGVISSRNWWEQAQTDSGYDSYKKPWALNRIWKCYINSPRDTRIMKLNRENITDPKEIETIEKAKEILQEFKIEVNF